LQYTCQRFSNNFSPEFTDVELMTVYLFVMTQQKHVLIKDIITVSDIVAWFKENGYSIQ